MNDYRLGELGYLCLLRRVLGRRLVGPPRNDRTGTGSYAVFCEHLDFDLRQGFPLLTTKAIRFSNVVAELQWFLAGRSDLGFLHERGCRIWDEWADELGECGRIYGVQWREWQTVHYEGSAAGPNNTVLPLVSFSESDQIGELIAGLRDDPYSRRHIVTAWNPGELDEMALPPCHMMFQCFVEDKYLDMQMYQRSADLGLGVPYNIASYALLLTLLAEWTGFLPRRLRLVFGDCHIYANHVEGLSVQVNRAPHLPPRLVIKDPSMEKWLGGELPEDVAVVEGYNYHPAIRLPISV